MIMNEENTYDMNENPDMTVGYGGIGITSPHGRELDRVIKDEIGRIESRFNEFTPEERKYLWNVLSTSLSWKATIG